MTSPPTATILHRPLSSHTREPRGQRRNQAPEATPWQTTQFRAGFGEPTQPKRPVVRKVHSQILGEDCPWHPEMHGDNEPKVLSREFPQAKLVPSLAEWETGWDGCLHVGAVSGLCCWVSESPGLPGGMGRPQVWSLAAWLSCDPFHMLRSHILSWPQSSFYFFHNSLWENLNELWGQLKTKSFSKVVVQLRKQLEKPLVIICFDSTVNESLK